MFSSKYAELLDLLHYNLSLLLLKYFIGLTFGVKENV